MSRLRQFFSALRASLSVDERALVAGVLSPAELQLFERMPIFDQRHCLDVYYTLVRGGYTDGFLLRAALIHDCGKVGDDGQTIPLMYYGVFVVMQRCVPRWYAWAARRGGGLLRPFAIHASHDRRSAALARASGSSEEVVAILEGYAERCLFGPTALLYWADEQH